jgi:hypothetical protein
MTISNPVAAFTKLVGEDSNNGVPVRLVDNTGNLPTTQLRSTIIASAAYPVSGVSAAQQLNGLYNELLFLLKVTAMSGTGGPTLNVFIDVSDDGGTTWYQAAQLGPNNIAAVPATTQGAYPSGYILTLSGKAGSSSSWGDTFRVRYQITGTTPSWTFQVVAIAKAN